MNPHLVIVRTGANVLDLKTYNCQELGLAKALTKKGLRVTLVMAGNEAKVEEYTCEGGSVFVHYLKFKCIDQRFGYFFGIDKKLEELKPNLIQVHDLGIFMTWYVTKWAKNHATPCYLIQGTYQTTPRFGIKQIEKFFCSTFGKYTLKNVSGIGCKTIMASRFIKGIYNRDTMLTYIGLDDNRFHNHIAKDWRKELGLENKRVLLYVGIMEERRRPLFLVDVLKTLPEEYVLVLVGKGPQWDDLKKRVDIENLQKRVLLLGKLGQDVLPSLYEQSDLFLLASEYEIYGMVLLESMYFGLPVISTYTAGSETLIESGKDSVIINEFDVDKWQNAILESCTDENKLNAMKQNARQKIQDEYVWDKAANSFLNLYKTNI